MRNQAAAGRRTAAADVGRSRGALLEGLTAEQREVVCHGFGPLLVHAGPGAGKTRVLIHRIAWLLQARVAKPWEILAVTFSVRAAGELRLRLRELLGVELASGVQAATFHSVCARLLRDHAHAFGRTGRWTVYDQQEVRRTLEFLLSERERGLVGALAAGEIQREISLAKNRLWTPASYELASAHQAAGQVARMWRELDGELCRCDAMDFDDVLAYTVTLLSEQPHVLRGLRERWRWLLVDEVQDSCPAQLELAALLAGPDGNVCSVGDEDQCVYGFRSADPGGMRRLAERFPGHRRVVLSRNFRSRAEILAPASRCVAHNPGRDARTLLAVRGPGGSARAVALRTDRDEAEWAAKTVKQALDGGVAPSEVLILCRAGWATQTVQAEFARAGVPHRVLGALGLYERAEVRDALAYLTLLSNPRDARAFARAVSAPRRGVGERTQARIVALARERHQGDLVRACAGPEALALLARLEARPKLRRFADGLLDARGQLRERSLSHVAIAVLTMAGGVVRHHQWLRDNAPSAVRRRDAERVLEDLRSLCRHVQAYESAEPDATLAGFLEQAAGLHAQEIGDGEEDLPITISSIHRAKGSEAVLVIVLGCEERLLPIRQALETGEQAPLEEERRLFYVACTRAKERLYLTHCAHRGGRPTAGPSRFLAEAQLIARRNPALAA